MVVASCWQADVHEFVKLARAGPFHPLAKIQHRHLRFGLVVERPHHAVMGVKIPLPWSLKYVSGVRADAWAPPLWVLTPSIIGTAGPGTGAIRKNHARPPAWAGSGHQARMALPLRRVDPAQVILGRVAAALLVDGRRVQDPEDVAGAVVDHGLVGFAADIEIGATIQPELELGLVDLNKKLLLDFMAVIPYMLCLRTV